jgi:hypothetical protein
MARLLSFALVIVLVGACAGLDESGDTAGEPPIAAEPPAEPPPVEPTPAETGGTEPATTGIDPGTEPPAPEPPAIVLSSAAGKQTAVQESFCVTDPAAGTGICADTPDLDPEQVSIVGPGEEVSVAFADGGNGELSLAARPLGCTDRELAPIDLVDGQWTVDLEPGAYELQAFATFGDATAPSGDTAGSLGLLVDPDREPAIVRAEPELFACAPSDEG